MNPWLCGVVLAMLTATSTAAHAGNAEPVRFGDKLNDKFHHERCLTCHQFTSRKYPGKSFTTHRSRYLCTQCHRPDVTGVPSGEWLVPTGMDFTGMNAADTCRFILRRMGADPSGDPMVKHLLHDARIRWALESGRLPDGSTVETVPGGYDAWRTEVLAWVQDGMRCD